MPNIRTKHDVVEYAKAWLIRQRAEFAGRRFLAANLDSYGSPDNRATLWALEGSPPRGFILVLGGLPGDKDDRKAIVLDQWGRQIATVRRPIGL